MGEDYKYDILYEWCSPPRDVDCGERPCNDAVHCPEDLTTTTKEPPCIPEDQIIDCRADEYGPGYYPDEYNCRAFWHCNKGESLGEHILCPQKSDDPKATMFDTTYMGCNFLNRPSVVGGLSVMNAIKNVRLHPPPHQTAHLIINISSARILVLAGFQMSSTVAHSGIASAKNPHQSTDSVLNQITIPRPRCLTPGITAVTSLRTPSVVRGLSVTSVMKTVKTLPLLLTVGITWTVLRRVLGGGRIPTAVSSIGTVRVAQPLTSSVLTG